MKKLIWVFIFLLISFSLIGETSSSNEEILAKGNEFFRQGNEVVKSDPWKARGFYEKAVVYFEKLIKDKGVKNGKLYYNTGNAWFRMGSLGNAILYYLKAMEYMPQDRNLIQNLAFARSTRLDSINSSDDLRLNRTLFFWHYELSLSVRVIIFIIFFLGFWGSTIAKLFINRGILTFLMVLCSVVALLFGGSLVAENFDTTDQSKGVIIAEESVARKGDSATYQKSFQDPLHSGSEFTLIESRRGWYNIELDDGRSCWIKADTAGLLRDL